MLPLISIIIPVYNVEKYLKRCVDSVINQTYPNLEIILVDDGSPDNCGKICDLYVDIDNRIIVIHKENEGLGPARNTGIDIFKGEYIMFLDSDDYLPPECTELLYNRIIDDKSDIVAGGYVHVFDDGTTKNGHYVINEDCVLNRYELLSGFNKRMFSVMAHGKLYKRDIIKSIRYPSLKPGEDLWALVDILDQCDKISLLKDTIYYYYQHSESIMHSSFNNNMRADYINANLRWTKYLLKNKCYSVAFSVYSEQIDVALHISCIKNRILLFKMYFDTKTRRYLLKNTNFETKVKWVALHFPFSNLMRSCFVKIKNKLK